MTATSMQSEIEALDGSTDWSDPSSYMRVVAAEDESDEPGAAAGSQGDNEPGTPPAVSSEPPAAAEITAPAPAPAAPAERVDGVLTRDGKHVIPYAALEAARTQAKTADERAQALLATVERLQNEITQRTQAAPAAPAEPADLGLTAEELADLEDIPAVGKLVKAVGAMQQRMAQAPAAAAPAPNPNARTEQDEFDEGIAANPLIAQWMAAGSKGASPEWSRAVELDETLKADPKYAGKTYAERFKTVQSIVAAEFGAALPRAAAPTPAPAPAGLRLAPTEAPEPSLDELAGTAPSIQQDRWASLNERDGLAAASKLSDEDLYRLAGVPQ